MRAVWRGVNVTLGGGGKSGLITLLSSSTATLLARARALSNSVSGNVSLSVSSEKTRVYRMLGLDKTVWGGWWRIGLAGKLGSVLKESAGYASKVHVLFQTCWGRGVPCLFSAPGGLLSMYLGLELSCFCLLSWRTFNIFSNAPDEGTVSFKTWRCSCCCFLKQHC